MSKVVNREMFQISNKEFVNHGRNLTPRKVSGSEEGFQTRRRLLKPSKVYEDCSKQECFLKPQRVAETERYSFETVFKKLRKHSETGV